MENSYLNLLKESDFIDLTINQVFGFYQQCYRGNIRYEKLVQHSERIPEHYRNHQAIGVSNRTLGLHVPCRNTVEGGQIRGALLQVGLLKSSGHELFRGCIVFPQKNDIGQIISAVGYRYGLRIRHKGKPIIHWQRPENNTYATQVINSIKEALNG